MHALPPVLPLFDTIEYLQLGNAFINQHITELSLNTVTDAGVIYDHACHWLLEQKYNENNYKAYRSELTSFLHWFFDVSENKAANLFSRKDISQYVAYCQNPPLELISYFNVPQFKLDKLSDTRLPNCAWRPFRGNKQLGKIQPYQLSDNALKTKLAILSSFYAYLMSEDYCERNPAQMWLNHSRFSSKKKYQIESDETNQMAFTELQWSYVISSVEALAKAEPELHQRSVFLIKLVYSCYLRISEVSARAGFSPVMSQFKLNRQTGIWSFHIPQSKGGKRRSVAISHALLEALKTYRNYLGLPELPSSNESHPLFIRHKAAGRGREAGLINANLGIRQIRDEIDKIIESAAKCAEDDGFIEDSIEMRKLSAHNIRHTGITHDINLNGRPLSHVQADAGHESIDTTSQYLHTSQTERHQSAVNKPLNFLDGVN